ncbi:hypothetical protein SLE2022_070200 [Rubroshorea leprosula]
MFEFMLKLELARTYLIWNNTFRAYKFTGYLLLSKGKGRKMRVVRKKAKNCVRTRDLAKYNNSPKHKGQFRMVVASTNNQHSTISIIAAGVTDKEMKREMHQVLSRIVSHHSVQR